MRGAGLHPLEGNSTGSMIAIGRLREISWETFNKHKLGERQEGGIRPEESRSNIFIARACRSDSWGRKKRGNKRQRA